MTFNVLHAIWYGLSRICLFAVAVMVIGLMPARAADDAVRECTTVSISGPTEYPPYSWLDGDHLEGAGHALALAVANKIGVKAAVNFTGAWPRTYARHIGGDVDIVVALYHTPAREKDLIYLQPWASERTIVIMNRKHAFEYNGWDDLIGRIGANTRSDSRGEKLDQFIIDKLTMMHTPTQGNLFTMLSAGRVDYLLLGEYSPYSWLLDDLASGLFAAEKPADEHQVYMTMARRSPCAAQAPRWRAALADLLADGMPARLIRDYAARQPRLQLRHP